jgi:hypothetical protein
MAPSITEQVRAENKKLRNGEIRKRTERAQDIGSLRARRYF